MRGERRKMMANNGLPSGYERLGYIENTSTAYIDTGIVLCEDLSFEGKFALTESTTINGYEAVVDSNVYDRNIPCYSVGFFLSKDVLLANVFDTFSTIRKKIDTAPDKVHSYRLQKGIALIDGTTYTKSPDSAVAENVTIKYFFQGYDNSHLVCRMFSGLIYKNNKLIINLCPAKRKADGVIGMYDLVSRKFYTSPNGIAFTGGVSRRLYALMPSCGERRAA